VAIIRAFRPFRYTAEAGPLAELIAPPYDVISPAERDALAARREACAIHVILPKGEEKYSAAAELLADWKARGLIRRDDEPAHFLSCQGFSAGGQDYERWGLLTTLQLERFEDDIVLPHERTLTGPKEDRLRLIRACRTNLSPIFCFVDTALGLAGLADKAEALDDFMDDKGVRQRVWKLTDEASMQSIVATIEGEQVFIADGHHRYETALGYRDERRAEAAASGGGADSDFVMAHICSTRDAGLAVLPTHRIPKKAPDLGAFEARCRELCEVTEMTDGKALWAALATAPAGERHPRLGIVLPGGKNLLLEPAIGAREKLAALAPELAILDVTFLHDVVLPEIPNDQFTYTHDESETIAAVENGSAGLAILLPPPSVEDVLSISRAALTMPQKSTYFYPKVPSGIGYNPI
jgi:uncharacterized protein (DUF1015 family)